MKDDYISREAVITEFCNILCGVDPQECQFKIPHDGAEHCTTVGAILAIPAADVRPVDADVLETQLVIDFDADDHILIADDLYAAPTIIPTDKEEP